MIAFTLLEARHSKNKAQCLPKMKPLQILPSLLHIFGNGIKNKVAAFIILHIDS